MHKNLMSWLDDCDWAWLMDFVSRAKGAIVELGTFRGGTAYDICRSMPAEYPFITIDNYADPEFQKYIEYNAVDVYNRLLEVKKNVAVVVGDVVQVRYMLGAEFMAWLVFVDACHDEADVIKSILTWRDVTQYMAIHDYHVDHMGVIRAVEYLRLAGIISDRNLSIRGKFALIDWGRSRDYEDDRCL